MKGVTLAGRAALLPTRLLLGAPLGILMYHAVVERPLPLPDWCFLAAARFEAQMRWLAGLPVDVLPLDEAVERLREGRLRRPAVAITFDDGYRNNLEVALPVLERYRLPATIYLATGFVGSDRAMWHCRLVMALGATGRDSLDWRGERLDLRGPTARAAANGRLQQRVKAVAGADPGGAVAEIEAALGVPVDPAVGRDSPFAMLDAGEIRAAPGPVGFGAHTLSHPILSRLDDARLATEIEGSVAAVGDLTGGPCRSFAYPNGRTEDYDARAVALLEAAGVAVAVTTSEAPNLAAADPLRLARWAIGADLPAAAFRAKVLNLHGSVLRTAFDRALGRASGGRRS